MFYSPQIHRNLHTMSSQIHLSSSRCAACKCLRRKCAPNCILAPYFPSSNPQRFTSVHKIFGASNITKILEQVPVHLRGQAAESVVFEAVTRMNDPIYGSAEIISQLNQQIMMVQNEIVKIQGEVAVQNVHRQQVEAQSVMHNQELCCVVGDLDERSVDRLYDFGGDFDNHYHLSTDFNG